MLDCIVIGDVMMDLLLRSDQKIVNSLKVDGTNYFAESLIAPGGSGNVAAAISHLGGRVALVGKAGNDAYGRSYFQDLQSLGVIPRLEFDPSIGTGLAVSLVEPGGHRTMLVSRGANDKLAPEEVRKHLTQLGPSKFIYLSGYSLLNPPQRDAILESAMLGREAKSRVVFDPGSANLIKGLPDVFEKTLDSCDILCANLEESKVFADGLDVSEYLRLLSRKGKSVVVKTGSQGCLIAAQGEFSAIPGVAANAIDTTGAGDCFLGALLYCLSAEFELAEAASFANWFASRKTEGLGPRHFSSKEESGMLLKSLREKKLVRPEEAQV